MLRLMVTIEVDAAGASKAYVVDLKGDCNEAFASFVSC